MTADLLLPMQIRALEDAHETRGFVPVATLRPLPQENFEPSLYGEVEGNYITPSTRPFDIRMIDGRLFMNAGFLEGVKVDGTDNFLSVGAAGAAIWLRAEISFVFTSFTAQHVDPEDEENEITITNYVKAGPYRIISASLLLLNVGTAPPEGKTSPLITTEPGDIHQTDLWFHHLGEVAANGQHDLIPTWLRVSADLSRIH